MSIDPSKIRPHGDRILVRRDDFDDVTAGGIVIPDIAKTAAEGSRQQLKRGRGVVLAVGQGTRHVRRKTRAAGLDAEGNARRNEAGDVVTVTTESHSERRVPLDVRPGDRVAFSILLELGDLDELGHPDLTIIRESDVEVVLEDDDDV